MANRNLTAGLPNLEKDKIKLKQKEAYNRLPDVEDDEGYANKRLPIGENVFSIISEEDLVGNPDDDDADESFKEDDLEITEDTVDEDSNVTAEEKEALERTENTDSEDNENLYRSELDDEDFDGEKLNEEEDFSGDDLDIPGVEEDDDEEAIGEEDEENNAYSLGDNE